LDYNSRHESLRLAGAARFVPDDRTRVALTLRLEDRQFHFPTNGAGALVDRNAFTFADDLVAQVSGARALTDALEIEARVAITETDGGQDDAFDDTSDTESFTSLEHFRRSTFQLMSHLRTGGAVLTLGGEVEEERQRTFSEVIFDPTMPSITGRNETERLNLAAFGHAATELGLVSLS